MHPRAANFNAFLALRTLGLCDLSALPRLGVKGPGAEGWLRGQRVEPPAAVYDSPTYSPGAPIAASKSNPELIGLPGQNARGIGRTIT